MASPIALAKRAPGSLAERFWSIAKSSGPAGDDATSPEPRAVVRHVLSILDALSRGEVGDGVSQSTVSFLALLRQQEAAGDLSYASPEQARGESLDERSLVFSIGVLLFEELTGRHPFGAVDTPRRFARIQKCELGSGVQYFPKVPAQLRTVLMKAMGPFPEERYGSLREMRAHLDRFVEGRADETPPREPRRPLKGLPPTPADVAFTALEENAATRIHKRTPPEGAPAQTAPAAPARPTTPVSATPAGRRVLAAASVWNSTMETRLLPRARIGQARSIIERVVWVLLGACVALGAAKLIGHHGHATVAVASPANVAGAPVVTAMELPHPLLTTPPTPPPPAKFDMQLAGRNAAARARECFAPERLAHSLNFGIGLLYDRGDTASRRTFLSNDELSPQERRCIAHALTGIDAGGASPRGQVIEYRFKLHPDGHDEFKAALAK